MTTCGTGTILNRGLCGETDQIDIGCLPRTSGEPSQPPRQDQLPIAIDTDGSCLWYYLCDVNQWTRICPGTICGLEEVDLSMIADICNILNLPVRYEMNGTCVEGVVSLSSFADAISQCLDLSSEIVILESSQIIGTTWRTWQAPPMTGADMLIDSKEMIDQGSGLGNAVNDPNFTFVNPTNKVGLLTVHSVITYKKLLAEITPPTTRKPLHNTPPEHTGLFSAVGLEQDLNIGNLANTQPDGDPGINVSGARVMMDVREMDGDSQRGRYKFYNQWRVSNLGNSQDINNSVRVNLSNTYVVQPNQSINLYIRAAVGMMAQAGAENDNYEIEMSIHYRQRWVFQGTT